VKLESSVPFGPLEKKWDKHRFEMKLVNPANKRKYTVIVVGSDSHVTSRRQREEGGGQPLGRGRAAEELRREAEDEVLGIGFAAGGDCGGEILVSLEGRCNKTTPCCFERIFPGCQSLKLKRPVIARHYGYLLLPVLHAGDADPCLRQRSAGC
jgi:hypothetical protein